MERVVVKLEGYNLQLTRGVTAPPRKKCTFCANKQPTNHLENPQRPNQSIRVLICDGCISITAQLFHVAEEESDAKAERIA